MLTFKVNANPPAPQGPEVTRVTMGDMPDDEIDFSNNVPTVVTGRGLALGANDKVKIELCPNKGEAVAVLDELEDVTSSDTQITFMNGTNSSTRPDCDWWGQDALLTVTVNGESATRWLKFHDYNQTS